MYYFCPRINNKTTMKALFHTFFYFFFYFYFSNKVKREVVYVR